MVVGVRLVEALMAAFLKSGANAADCCPCCACCGGSFCTVTLMSRTSVPLEKWERLEEGR